MQELSFSTTKAVNIPVDALVQVLVLSDHTSLCDWKAEITSKTLPANTGETRETRSSTPIHYLPIGYQQHNITFIKNNIISHRTLSWKVACTDEVQYYMQFSVQDDNFLLNCICLMWNSRIHLCSLLCIFSFIGCYNLCNYGFPRRGFFFFFSKTDTKIWVESWSVCMLNSERWMHINVWYISLFSCTYRLRYKE